MFNDTNTTEIDLRVYYGLDHLHLIDTQAAFIAGLCGFLVCLILLFTCCITMAMKCSVDRPYDLEKKFSQTDPEAQRDSLTGLI